jgi:hypothetical protein
MSRPEQDGTLVPVWFIAPEGFTPIPLTEEVEARAASFADVLDDLYPDVAPVEKLSLIGANEMLVQQLLRDGVIYMASFLYALEDESLCSGMVAAFMVDGPVPGGARFAERLVAEVPGRFPGQTVDAGVVTVPAGRAAMIARDVPGPSAASLLSSDHSEERELQRQIETYLPFPDGSAYLQVVMATADLHAWDELLPIFGGFIASISFSPPVVTNHQRSSALRAEAEEQMRREFG